MSENIHKAPEGIFCSHGPSHYKMTDKGVLAGKRLAVKDLFQLKGFKNTAGNPDWYATHEKAETTASSLSSLLQEGAIFTGFTVTDELAYSLQGSNIHFGAADNPKVLGHHCGGSSVGSAAAVAAGLADIGLGTDTGGSVRVPASYCGLYGIRPSHGRVASEGLIGLAKPFDTVGWFTHSAELLADVGRVLINDRGGRELTPRNTRLIICPEILALASDDIQQAINSQLDMIKQAFDQIEVVHLSPDTILNDLNNVFSVLQGRACAEEHGQWINDTQPNMAKDIKARFEAALALSDDQVDQANAQRKLWQEELACLLNEADAQVADILLLPSAVTAAPKKGVDQTQLRQRLLNLTAIAGLTESVQVHIPSFDVIEDGLKKPSGFSLLMPSGNDEFLLGFIAEKFSQRFSD